MPELPEVETVVREIRPLIKGRVFLSPAKLKGKKVLDVKRRGKNIVIRLSDKRWLLIHLKMTGRILWEKDKYVRHTFKLDDKNFYLSDPRKFTRVTIEKNLDRLGSLGPEATEPFDVRKYKGKIKSILMKQEIIAGIGNIYSDEILWRSRVHPLRPACSLSANEMKRISDWARRILLHAIELKGDSNKDFIRPDGEKGSFQYEHRAYGRAGQPCFRNDGGVIKKIKVGGRSASFCPVCQK